MVRAARRCNEVALSNFRQYYLRHSDTDALSSPEDHAILEAEYLRNPKPDKAARVEIVNRVALGEREVQVR